MKNIINFDFNGSEVRTINQDNEPWFIAKDIADILGYSETSAMTRYLDIDEIMSVNLAGMNMKSSLINESGLYSAILRSRLPQAKEFKKWVTSEVLPSIRKNGIYATDLTIEKMLNDPDFAISLLTKLKEEKEARLEAERKNNILMHVNKTYTATEVAKEAGFKSANEMNKFLHDKKFQYKSNGTWVMYSKYSSMGYESIKQEVLDNGRVIYHRRITQLGREFILSMI